MDSQTVKILRELVAIRSSCDLSNEEIVNYLRETLSQYRQQAFTFTHKGTELVNLVVKIPGKSKTRPLVFICHTDTVPPGKEWKTDPFKPVVKGKKIYGLGTNDMKGAIAAVTSVALSIKKTPPHDVYLIFDADEEGEAAGARDLLKNFKLVGARIIIPEPTSGQIVVGQKGCLGVEVELSGKASHGSTTTYKNNIRNNAIYKMVKVCNKLIEYDESLQSKGDKTYGNSNLNIGVIGGGQAPNVVADSCFIKLERRLLPTESLDKEFKDIKSLIRELDPKAKLKINFYGPPFSTKKSSPFVTNIRSVSQGVLGKTPKFDFYMGWTEAGLFNQWGECVIFGPGLKNVSHIPNEYIDMDSVVVFQKIFSKIIQQPSKNIL